MVTHKVDDWKVQQIHESVEKSPIAKCQMYYCVDGVWYLDQTPINIDKEKQHIETHEQGVVWVESESSALEIVPTMNHLSSQVHEAIRVAVEGSS